jgi:hypothetical protein
MPDKSRPAVALREDGDAPTAHDLSSLGTHGPEFTALVADLRGLAQRQDTLAKAEVRRRAVSDVMAKAAEMFAAGRITALDVSRLHALRLRLDDGLLPEERN